MKPMSIWISDEEKEAAKKAAAKLDMSLSQVVRGLLRSFVKESNE